MTTRLALVLAAAAALILGVAFVIHELHHQGEVAVLMQQAAATHKADSVGAVALRDSSVAATHDADSTRAALRAHERGDRAVHAKLDSATAALAVVRDAAERVLADSQATLQDVRASLRATLQASAASDVAHRARELADSIRIAEYGRVLRADSTALGKGALALIAMERRAVDAEHERDLYRQNQPSSFWAAAKLLGAGIAGYEAGRVAATGHP